MLTVDLPYMILTTINRHRTLKASIVGNFPY